MEAELLKIFGMVAGIGGLAIGTLLILYRDVIRKSIFPRLTKEQGFRLLRLLLVLVWSVAVIGMVVWYYATRDPAAEPANKPPISPPCSVVIDAVQPVVASTDADVDCSFDIVLRNAGVEPANITKMRLAFNEPFSAATDRAEKMVSYVTDWGIVDALGSPPVTVELRSTGVLCCGYMGTGHAPAMAGRITLRYESQQQAEAICRDPCALVVGDEVYTVDYVLDSSAEASFQVCHSWIGHQEPTAIYKLQLAVPTVLLCTESGDYTGKLWYEGPQGAYLLVEVDVPLDLPASGSGRFRVGISCERGEKGYDRLETVKAKLGYGGGETPWSNIVPLVLARNPAAHQGGTRPAEEATSPADVSGGISRILEAIQSAVRRTVRLGLT